MVVTEPLKFVALTWIFARSMVGAVAEMFKDIKKKENQQPTGIGLRRGIDTLPDELPTATDIKKMLPKHCFEPKISTSMYYAIKDAVLVAITFAAIFYVHSTFQNSWIWYPALLVYWCVQGTLFTAVFVVGHDCGHDSFSTCGLLNDVVGTIMHTFILCPFYMWKLSHRHHHKNTGNLDKDEVFYPLRISEVKRHLPSLPLFGLGFAWFFYLFVGYGPRPVNHFNLGLPLFSRHLIGCTFSLVSCLIAAACTVHVIWTFGITACLIYYFIPLWIFSTYMLVITFLHHSEMNTPWYSDENWEFVRGQLSSIDRHYGAVHDVIHSIGTHQMHHMFSKIPHYYLDEATMHFRKHFPQLVRMCDEPIMASFVRMWKKYASQGSITDETRIHYYN